MTYGEAVARLLALRGGERPGMRPGLERIETLLDALGRPERTYRIVYRFDGSEFVVLTVFEGHRLLRPDEIEE